MTEPTLSKKVLALALPLMIGNLSQMAISLADTWFVGQVGKIQLAAMAQAGVVYLVCFLVLSAPFMGIQALTARRFGAKKTADCGIAFNTGLVLQICSGLVAGFLALFFIGDIVDLVFSGNENLREVLPFTTEYLRIRLGGALFMTVLWTYRGFFYGIGITRPDMWAGIGMNLLNVCLDYLLVLGKFGAPRMEIAGAAWASVLATGMITMAMTLFALQRKYRITYGLFRFTGVRLKMLKSILTLSGPRAIQAAAFGGSIIFFKLIGDTCGEDALAASIIVWRCVGVCVLTALAFGAAAGTMVGQRLGAGDPEGADLSARAAARAGFLITLGIGILIFLFPAEIISIFSDKPEVAAIGKGPMRLLGLFQCFDSIGIVLARALAAAGCIVYVMKAELFTSFCVMAVSAWFMTRVFPGDLTALWGAWVAYIICWLACMVLKFRGSAWKSTQI